MALIRADVFSQRWSSTDSEVYVYRIFSKHEHEDVEPPSLVVLEEFWRTSGIVLFSKGATLQLRLV